MYNIIPYYEGRLSTILHYVNMEDLADLVECVFYGPYVNLNHAADHINRHGFNHITLTIL